jgi:hypothetical protein
VESIRAAIGISIRIGWTLEGSSGWTYFFLYRRGRSLDYNSRGLFTRLTSMPLLAKGKNKGVVMTAVGRELLGFIWAIGIKAETAQKGPLQRAA